MCEGLVLGLYICGMTRRARNQGFHGIASMDISKEVGITVDLHRTWEEMKSCVGTRYGILRSHKLVVFID